MHDTRNACTAAQILLPLRFITASVFARKCTVTSSLRVLLCSRSKRGSGGRAGRGGLTLDPAPHRPTSYDRSFIPSTCPAGGGRPTDTLLHNERASHPDLLVRSDTNIQIKKAGIVSCPSKLCSHDVYGEKLADSHSRIPPRAQPLARARHRPTMADNEMFNINNVTLALIVIRLFRIVKLHFKTSGRLEPSSTPLPL